MKLQRTFIYIAGVFFAIGFAESQAGVPPPPMCQLVIEVNALRAGARFIQAGSNQTRDVTAKARILKGTADKATVIDTTLTIEAVTGGEVISTNSQGPIRLGVGKGGKGAKLSMAVPKCTGGFIDFWATFYGTDEDGDPCERTRSLRKECR